MPNVPPLITWRRLLVQHWIGAQAGCLAETEQLFRATLFLNKRRFTAWVNRMPNPFSLVRLMLRQNERTLHIDADQESIDDSSQAFALTTYRCYIHDYCA